MMEKKTRACGTCHRFLPKEEKDPHLLCFLCRPCSQATPCEFDLDWTAEDWDAFEKERAAKREAERQRKEQRRTETAAAKEAASATAPQVPVPEPDGTEGDSGELDYEEEDPPEDMPVQTRLEVVPDIGIGNLIVKGVAKEIVHPLTTIFNRSLITGKVPNSLKIAKVIPIHKKDDKEIFSNYRPVSVLPCFSKILERLIFNRCTEFIENNNILNAKQFGFRAHHSTYMAIMQLVDKINNAVEKNETTIGVYLDLSKAFDTIDHDILLHKLDYYGFRGIVLDWFRDYLSNRTQYVSYNNNKSDLKTILCGVPQGSILGPLLFILYINDITNTSTLLDFLLFADDTTILFSSSDIVSKIPMINRELSEVSNWFKSQ